MQCSLIHINTEHRELIDVWGSVRRGQLFGAAGLYRGLHQFDPIWTKRNSCRTCARCLNTRLVQIGRWHGCIGDLGTVSGPSEAQGSNISPSRHSETFQIGEAAAATDDAGDRLDNTCDGVSLRYPAVVRVMSRYAVAKGHWVVGGVAPPLLMSPRRPRYSSAAHLKLCRTQTKRCSVKQDSSVSFFYKQTDIKAQTSFLFSLFFF